MFVIALTGGIGSGKTTISDLFREKNIPIIDTDVIAREIVEPNKLAYQEIIKTFGEAVLNTDQTINRQALGKLIFSNTEKRLQLESILHPIIWQEVNSQLNSLSTAYCVVVVPLLLENLSEITKVKFDRILVVDVEEKTQIIRSQKRDDSEIKEIKNIIQNQVSRQTRLNSADDIILNEGSIDSLNEKVNNLHLEYLKLSK